MESLKIEINVDVQIAQTAEELEDLQLLRQDLSESIGNLQKQLEEMDIKIRNKYGLLKHYQELRKKYNDEVGIFASPNHTMKAEEINNVMDSFSQLDLPDDMPDAIKESIRQGATEVPMDLKKDGAKNGKK